MMFSSAFDTISDDSSVNIIEEKDKKLIKNKADSFDSGLSSEDSNSENS